MYNNKSVVLCVLDGWGIGKDDRYNAIKNAKTPTFDFLSKNFPSSRLRADGRHVGLLPGQMGNSEVGHMTIGAGRAIPMSLPKIDQAIAEDSLKDSTVIRQFIKALKKSGGVAHLAGLFSNGGVHAHQTHMIYLANVIADEGIKVNLHLFLDGRDVPPNSAVNDIKRLEFALAKNVEVVTLIGRFYAMDRDNRWDRVEKAYQLITQGIGIPFNSAELAILSRYEFGETDEFIQPCSKKSYNGFSKTSDALFFMNFRADRAREILSALCDPSFNKFPRDMDFSLVAQSGMVEYSPQHAKFMKNVLSQDSVENTLGQCLSRANKTQVRLAETEKYPHVTFFFNAGVEIPYAGEQRLMIPSPKVKTYDLMPEMSAKEITLKLIDLVRKNSFDFILVNYANPDMVGHSGSLEAAIQACEIVDSCLGQVYNEVSLSGGTLIVTADHGNCEIMFDPTIDSPHTSHTLNSVPFIVVGANGLLTVKNGSLSDIAPTILNIFEIAVPMDMTGRSLLEY